MKINVTPDFTRIIEKKYKLMIQDGIKKDFLNKERFGGLCISINDPLEIAIYVLNIGLDTVYIGGKI